jgi:hypothetical protein
MDTISPLHCLISAGLISSEQASAIGRVPTNYASAILALGGLSVSREGLIAGQTSVDSIPLMRGKRYTMIIGYEGDNFNSQTITPHFSPSATKTPLIGIPLPGETLGSTPVAADEPTVFEFVASDDFLVLELSGSITSVNWKLSSII